MPISPLGAQLYIFRGKYDLQKDMSAILQNLAESGYGAVEGFDGQPAGRDTLEANGLVFIGPHVVLSALIKPDKLIADTLQIGGRDIVSSGLSEWNERSADNYRAAADALNTAGRRLREQGVFLHYHNHDFEFQIVAEGRTGYDLLLEGLDSEAVTLCVDTGWVWRAGVDPVEFLRQHSERVGMVHLRDWKAGRAVALGQGEMNLEQIVQELPHLPNLRWTVVEQDPDSDDPVRDMRDSRAFLRDQFGL